MRKSRTSSETKPTSCADSAAAGSASPNGESRLPKPKAAVDRHGDDRPRRLPVSRSMGGRSSSGHPAALAKAAALALARQGWTSSGCTSTVAGPCLTSSGRRRRSARWVARRGSKRQRGRRRQAGRGARRRQPSVHRARSWREGGGCCSTRYGTLKPLVGEDAANQKQVDMTCDVMVHSLVYWTQDL